MDKQRFQKLAGITPASEQLAELISQSIASVDEHLSYADLARAVAEVLKKDYGIHNYEPFLEVLKSTLNPSEPAV